MELGGMRTAKKDVLTEEERNVSLPRGYFHLSSNGKQMCDSCVRLRRRRRAKDETTSLSGRFETEGAPGVKS